MEAAESWRNYAIMCRLCMNKGGFMIGIFNHMAPAEKSIHKKIIDCTALNITQGDGLPNSICHRCLYKIEMVLEFRRMCFISDVTLRQASVAIATENSRNGELAHNPNNQIPYLEQLTNGNEEDVVMVVDPTAQDYESDYDSDNNNDRTTTGGQHNRQQSHLAGVGGGNNNGAISDNELTEMAEPIDTTFGGKGVSMCRYCDHAFTDALECMDHENTAHDSEVPYSCKSCEMVFGDRVQYSAHQKGVHQNDKPYNCPQCERTFARRSDLRKHTVVHTGIKPYTCVVCSKSFSRNTNLSKHMRIHSGQKPFVCPKCPKTFFSKGDLTRHAIIHSGHKPYQCRFCHVNFGRKDKLARHERRHLPGRTNRGDRSMELQMMRENMSANDFYQASTKIENNFDQTPPDLDDKDTGGGGGGGNNSAWPDPENMVISLDPYNHNSFTSGGGGGGVTPGEGGIKTEQPSETDLLLQLHHHNHDPASELLPKIPDHIVEQAQHITGDAGYHHRRHHHHEDNNKRYACDKCSKTFTNPENMRYHQAAHSGVRPHVCTVCKKSFIRKRELDRHYATHTGSKPYKCPTCTKAFGRKDKLVRHMRIHEEHKEHSCELCGATFNRKDGLLQHMRTHDHQPLM